MEICNDAMMQVSKSKKDKPVIFIPIFAYFQFSNVA
jgi:hypothetical protein